jgi:hypothetical protein
LRQGAPVMLDFAGVESITESFAHELLRPFPGHSEIQATLLLRHFSPVVEATIRFVLSEALGTDTIPTFVREAKKDIGVGGETAAVQGVDTWIQLHDASWAYRSTSSAVGEQPAKPTTYVGVNSVLVTPRVQVSDPTLAEPTE